MRLRVTSILCVLLAAGLATADKVDDYLLKFMADKKIPGLQIGIYRDGKTVKVKGYGTTEPSGSIEVTERTLFNIGSVTKQFTATAVMLLAEEGKLSVDDSVRKWIPDLPADFEPMKLKHVMSHTAGLGDYASVPGFDFHADVREADFLKLLGKSKPTSPAGEKYAYSNIGYALLGAIVARSSGKPYEAFVKERIFDRIGMDSTAFIQRSAWPKEAASGFNLAGDKLNPGRKDRAPVAAPSGAMLTNVVDMAKWDAALRGEGLLKKSSLDRMWTSATLNDGKLAGYGFGWNVLKNGSGHFVLHTGATVSGFRAAIVRQLDGPYSAVVFVNLGAELGLTKVLNDVVKLWMENGSGA